MGTYTLKLPDVGEGIAEAELTGWMIKVGDMVREDDIIAEIMTDKAAVEIPAPVSGKVEWLGGEVGDTLAIGCDLVRFEAASDVAKDEPPASPETKAPVAKAESDPTLPKAEPKPAQQREPPAMVRPPKAQVLASPSVRAAARNHGVDLRQVQGAGPAGRISHDDLVAFLNNAPRKSDRTRPAELRKGTVSQTKVIGLRKKIAERMSLSKSRIPHITIVEEVDVTDIEKLRGELNQRYAELKGKLTLLPFICRAMVNAVDEQPVLNSHYDDENNMIHTHGTAHIGIATQTANGLLVPVLKDAHALDLWQNAAEIGRLSKRARDGKASREELSGSTITISSLGPLGAIATTPIINHPEVTIVGVNKIATRPVWTGVGFDPRKVMNLSCSFDHRIVDGWDAAVFVQRLKSLLEIPATLFLEGAD